MEVRYTLHALERMRQRRISRNIVEACLHNPDKKERIEDAYRCVKKLNNKVLVVIYRKTGDSILIITAYTSTKIYKYLTR